VEERPDLASFTILDDAVLFNALEKAGETGLPFAFTLNQRNLDRSSQRE